MRIYLRSYDLDLDQMTLIYELSLGDVRKKHYTTKLEPLRSDCEMKWNVRVFCGFRFSGSGFRQNAAEFDI